MGLSRLCLRWRSTRTVLRSARLGRGRGSARRLQDGPPQIVAMRQTKRGGRKWRVGRFLHHHRIDPCEFAAHDDQCDHTRRRTSRRASIPYLDLRGFMAQKQWVLAETTRRWLLYSTLVRLRRSSRVLAIVPSAPITPSMTKSSALP